MLGLPYERGATTMRCYLDVLDQALRGPGMVDVENELFTIHNPLDITDITPTPVMIAALGPVMLKLAGERAAGTTLWLADERTIGVARRPDHHEGRRGGGPTGAPHPGRRPRLPLPRRRDRGGRRRARTARSARWRRPRTTSG